MPDNPFFSARRACVCVCVVCVDKALTQEMRVFGAGRIIPGGESLVRARGVDKALTQEMRVFGGGWGAGGVCYKKQRGILYFAQFSLFF